MNEEYVIFTLVGQKNSLDRKKLNTSITIVNQNESFKFIAPTTVNLKNNNQDNNDMENIDLYDEFKYLRSPLIVVAIDFGTAYSGYAFSFKNDKEKVYYMKKNLSLDYYSKVPTALLLDQRKELHSFGYEAKNFFHNLDRKKSSKYYYFEDFKMNLYHEEVNDKWKLKPLNQTCGIDALKIFSICLEYLCSEAIKEISEQCAFSLTKDDICWIITVPAIWSDSSKQFMRLAAEKTNHIDGESLRIALEPEVASLYCRKFLLEECESNKTKNLPKVYGDSISKSGTNYLIVDFGGGTVDITAHEIQINGFIKETHKSTGGPFGCNEINKQFEQIISSIFGNKLWKKFKKDLPSTYLDFMQTFELRKREANPERNTSYNILLTYSFIQYFSSLYIEKIFDKAPNGLAFSSKLGIIRIDAPFMRKLFQLIIEPIIQIIRSLLNGPLRKKDIRYIFLVGGFAQSLILRQEIKLAFEPTYNVIVPHQAHLAVLYGACQYGLDPTLIQSRRVMRTYGIAILLKFDPSIHPIHKKLSKDGFDWCCDVLDRFVLMNQSIGMFESIKRKYKPVISNQTSCIFHIYSTTNLNAQFITDPGVNKCGTLYLELDPIYFPKNVNPAIKQLVQREIEVEMFFGETEIKISAKDLHSGYLVKSNIDFFSKMNY